MKTTYIVRELQNLQSQREGTAISATTLSEAKRIASKNQSFCGTVLVIENANGSRLCYKKDGQSWKTLDNN